MKPTTINSKVKPRPLWQDYLELCKPKVVLLMIITSIVGMCLATKGAPSLALLFWANIGIALVASAAACVNHVADQRVDRVMLRTSQRPIVKGKINTRASLIFAVSLCVLGLLILFVKVNALTAILSVCSLVGYAGIYTFFLKNATSQNIVIGGLAGASPPLLGWCAVTGHISAAPLILVLIIFVWTPPHFWALAIYRFDDYKKAKTPMLPVTHGIPHTKLQILLYSVLLFGVTLLPFAIDMASWVYLILAIALNGRFLYYAIRLYRSDDLNIARAMFRFSIAYLFYLFVALLIDHYLPMVSALF